VGRIRVDGAGSFARGEELARFEMGSTVVLVVPPGSWRGIDANRDGAAVRLGEPIGKALS